MSASMPLQGVWEWQDGGAVAQRLELELSRSGKAKFCTVFEIKSDREGGHEVSVESYKLEEGEGSTAVIVSLEPRPHIPDCFRASLAADGTMTILDKKFYEGANVYLPYLVDGDGAGIALQKMSDLMIFNGLYYYYDPDADEKKREPLCLRDGSAYWLHGSGPNGTVTVDPATGEAVISIGDDTFHATIDAGDLTTSNGKVLKPNVEWCRACIDDTVPS